MNKCTEVLNSLNQITLYFANFKHTYKCNRKNIEYLIHYLEKVPDFRSEAMVTYKLENILAICFIFAMRGRFQSFYSVATRLKLYPEEFIRLGLVEKDKIPSHDTFRRVFMYLDANKLRDVFLKEMQNFLEKIASLDKSSKNKKRIIAGDGKSFNSSGRKDKFGNLNVFNIYDVSNGLCLSSTPLDDKESEIPEFERLITKFKINNAIITADALHCQRKLCEKIIKHQGEYVIKVKDNQKELRKEISHCFETNKYAIESKKFNECDYQIMKLPKNYIGCDWPGQAAYIKMVSHKRIKQKDYNPENQYFIASLSNLACIIETIDNRWCIENELHLFKDTFLNEDECTFYNKNSVKVMATINNIVFGFYKLASSLLSDKSMCETRYKFEDNPLKLISLILPYLNDKDLPNLIKQNMRGNISKD